MERFYPNFYSYTKSHYEPLVSSLLTRSESERSSKLHNNDSNDKLNETKQFSWCNERQHFYMDENNEQQNSVASPNISRQRLQSMDRVKISRSQPGDWINADSQRWMRENSDPPRREKSPDGEILSNCDSIGSVQSFILPYTRINEYLTPGTKVKQPSHHKNAENGINCLGSVSHNNIRNHQQYPDLMSTSFIKTASSAKHKSRSLRKHSREETIPCSNHDHKTLLTTDRNVIFMNPIEAKPHYTPDQNIVCRSRRLPSPCVRMKSTLETEANSNLLPGIVHNTSASNYDLRPKRLIETERMVRQELASAKHKSSTFNNNSTVRDNIKSVKQNSPRSLKKSCSNEKKQTVLAVTDSQGSDTQDSNSVELKDSELNSLPREFDKTVVFSAGVNYDDTDDINSNVKDNAIEALEDNVENMTVRIEQLQALDNLKSSEIRELQSIISRLRGEDMNSKSLTSSPSHFQPRPPRSTSCRTLPDAIYQDIQDAISLSSFTSGTSAGSQDPSVHFQQQQQQKQQQRKIILKTEGKCSSRTGSSPTASDTERSNGKHSRWLRTSFSKAFRKRTKSNIHTNDQMTINDSTITNLQPNLQDQISMNSQKSGYEQELERLHLTVSQMRWQMDLLEARNKKLQEIILKHNPDEFAHKELCLESTERKVTLFDLISKYCQNACHIVQVFVNTASIHQRNFNQNSSTYQGDNYLNNNNTPTSAQLNCTKLFKIGCIGLHDEMTWDDMDKQLQKLFQHHIDFLDPHEQLRLHSLEPQAYQLNFMFTDQGEMKTQSIVRCFCLPSCSMSLSLPTSSTCSKIENQSQMTCALVLTPTTSMDREISSQSPAIWVNDIIKEHDAKTYTLSLQVHLKGCPMKFSLEKEHNIRHPTVVGNTDMLKYVCFGSLVPLNTLNSYLSLIQQNPVVIICGPSGTGKSHLVNDLTRLLIRDPFDVNAIYKFWFKNDGGTTLKEVKNTLNQQLASHAKYGFPEVINLFNIHHLKGSLLDILSLLNTSLKCPTIIGTSENGNDELEKACTNTHIKIINHLSDKKDAKEYLERSLYRKLAQYRLFTSFYSLCGSNEDRISMNTFVTQVEDKNLYYLIPWLSEFWNQLHEIPCSLTQKNHLNIFGLRTFLTCPMHSQVSLNWFLDLWNNMLVPILFKDAKQAITIVSLEENLSNMFKMLNNFLGWITTTWPWNPTGVNFPTSIKEPKITLTQNSLSMIKNYQLILSTSCNSDAEICKHRTSMDSGIILDGMYPTNSGISSSYENNTSTLCNNNNYYYPNSVTESQDVQQNAHNTHDCNQLVTMLYQLQHENQTTGSCSKTVSSID